MGGGQDCSSQRGAQRGLAWGFGKNKAEGGMSDAHKHWDGQLPFAEAQRREP